MMAEKINDVLEQIFTNEAGRKTNLTVTVLHVEKFISNKAVSQTIPKDNNIEYGFDVVITDGDVKLKCILDEPLNAFAINDRSVSPGKTLVIKEMRMINDVISISECNKIALISSADIPVAPPKRIGQEEILKLRKTIDWVNHSSISRDKMESELPLMSLQPFYLPLWSDIDLHEKCFSSYSPGDDWQISVSEINSDGNFIRIPDMGSYGTHFYKPKVIGTVVAKSKLRQKKNYLDKIPFCFMVELSDSKGRIEVVFWEEQCARYFHRIELNDTLMIDTYKVQNNKGCVNNLFIGSTPSIYNPHRLSIDGFKKDRHAVYKVIGDIKTNILTASLPPVRCRFIMQSHIAKGGFGEKKLSIFDIMGVVVYIGEEEIESSSSLSGDVTLYPYKWILIVDGSASGIIAFKIYPISQPTVVQSLSVGGFVIALRVLYKKYQDTSTEHCYFTTSMGTQMYAFDSLACASTHFFARNCIYFQRIKEWYNSYYVFSIPKSVACLKPSIIYPPLPVTIDEYFKIEQNESTIVSINGLEDILRSLNVMEHKLVAIKGTITSIEIIGEKVFSQMTCQQPINSGKHLRGISRTKFQINHPQNPNVISSCLQELIDYNQTINDDIINNEDITIHLPNQKYYPLCILNLPFDNASKQMRFLGDAQLIHGDDYIVRTTYLRILIQPLNSKHHINAFFMPMHCKPDDTNLCYKLPSDYIPNDNKLINSFADGCKVGNFKASDLLDDVEKLKGLEFFFCLNVTNFDTMRPRFLMERAFLCKPNTKL